MKNAAYNIGADDWPVAASNQTVKQGWYIALGVGVRAPIRPSIGSRFVNFGEAQEFVIASALAGDPLCREAIAMLMAKRLQGETA